MRKKKLLSTMLALSLAMSMIPAAMAYTGGEDTTVIEDTGIMLIDDTESSTTNNPCEAIFKTEDSTNGESTVKKNCTITKENDITTIQLNADISTSTQWRTSTAGNYVLDLNGYSYTYSGDAHAIYVVGTSSAKTSLTIINTGSEKSSTEDCGVYKVGNGTLIIVDDYATLTIGDKDDNGKNGTMKFDLDNQSYTSASSCVKVEPASSATIYAGEFSSNNTDMARAIDNCGSMEIYGGTFNDSVQSRKYRDSNYTDNNASNSGNMTISGGTFKSKLTVKTDETEKYSAGIVTITGGNFTDNNFNFSLTASNANNIQISGGTFHVDPSSVTIDSSTVSLVASGYGVQKKDNSYMVRNKKFIAPEVTVQKTTDNDIAPYTVSISGLDKNADFTVQVSYVVNNTTKYSAFYLKADDNGEFTLNAAEGAQISVLNGKVEQSANVSNYGAATVIVGQSNAN